MYSPKVCARIQNTTNRRKRSTSSVTPDHETLPSWEHSFTFLSIWSNGRHLGERKEEQRLCSFFFDSRASHVHLVFPIPRPLFFATRRENGLAITVRFHSTNVLEACSSLPNEKHERSPTRNRILLRFGVIEFFLLVEFSRNISPRSSNETSDTLREIFTRKHRTNESFNN